MKAAESAHGQLDRPAKRVAVVGAGVSGVATAAHLRAAGVDVTVFERSPVAGGVWYVD
jgi:cation diffusion facilitator CzcD-associated flavoprotein CzcO